MNSIPPWIIERRKHIRTKVKGSFEWMRFSEQGKKYVGEVVDISFGGIKFHANRLSDLDVGETVSIALDSLTGKVIRISMIEGNKMEVAVKFLSDDILMANVLELMCKFISIE